MITKLKSALAIVAEEAQKPAAEQNRQRLAEALRASEEAVRGLAAAAGGDGATALDAFKKTVQAEIDRIDEAHRKLARAGLVAQAGGMALAPRTRDERLSMLADRRAFMGDGTAERFGAYYLAVRHPSLLSGRGRELAKDVVKLARDEVSSSETKDVLPDLSTTVTTQGEYALPDEFLAELIRNVEAVGQVYTAMRRLPLFTLGATSILKRTGGLTAYPTAAGAKIRQSGVTLDLVTLNPVKWATLTAVPNEFFAGRTLVAIGQFVALEIVYAMAYAFDNAVVNGDGTADYGNIDGFLHNTDFDAAQVVTLADDHDAGSEIAQTDLDQYELGLTVQYPGMVARWWMHLTMMKHIKNIRNATSIRTAYDEGGGGVPPTINGYPFTVSNVFPARGAIGADKKWGAFGDLAFSHIFGVLQALRIDTSQDALFTQDMAAIRGIAYVDCEEADITALTILKTHS